MIIYLDSSVVLRILLNEPAPIAEWGAWERAYSSVLLPIEAGRAIARVVGAGTQNLRGAAPLHAAFATIWRDVRELPLDPEVARTAAGPFPLPVKALDAIHIATALSVAKTEPEVVFATHDRQQAAAATAMGLSVVGI